MSSFAATMDSFLDSDLDYESDSDVDFDSYTLSRQRQNAILRHLFRVLFNPVPDDDSDADDSDADDSDSGESDDESEPVTPKISSR
jgi:hypothetical protein